MIQGPEEGWASSAAVFTCPVTPGRWQWTASGRHGMTMGSAATEEQAWQFARAAQAQLNRSMTPRGVG